MSDTEERISGELQFEIMAAVTVFIVTLYLLTIIAGGP